MIDSPHRLAHFSPLTHRQISILALILIAGACIRFYQISGPSLWLDEIWSIEMARGQGSQHDQFVDGVIRTDQPDPTSLATAAPWWQIWSHLQRIIHPPLYFVVLRWWMDLFGNSACAVRYLSAVVSVLAIGVFFDVGRLLHGSRISLIATAIMALAIGQIDFAQEARSYPLLILLGLCCCGAIARIESLGISRRRLAILAASLAAMLLTHYLAAGAVVAMASYVWIRLRGRARLKTIAAFVAAALLVLAVWGRQFQQQMRSFPNFSPSFLREDMPWHSTATLLRATELPLQFLCGDRLGARIPIPFHLAAAAAIALGTILSLRAGPAPLLWVIWILGIVGWTAAMDLVHDSMLLRYLRYTILASPGLYALLACVGGRPWMRDATAAAIIGGLAIFAGARLHDGVPAKEDFRLLSNIIDSHALPDELLIYYNQSDFVSPGVWYMCYKYYSPQSHHPWMTLRHPADAKVLAQLRQCRRLWLIGRQPEIDGPGVLPGWQPEFVWPTSAGRACLMGRLADVPAPVH